MTNLGRMDLTELGRLHSQIREELLQRHHDTPELWKNIKGHEAAKRAIIVAAIQKQSVLFYGCTGYGRSMLAVASAQLGVPSMKVDVCPCGNFSDPKRACGCSTTKLKNWVEKKIRPLAELAEIHIEVSSVPAQTLLSNMHGTTLEQAKDSLSRAISVESISDVLEDASLSMLKTATNELGLTASCISTIKKTAKSIAALAQSKTINVEHILEAIHYRRLLRS